MMMIKENNEAFCEGWMQEISPDLSVKPQKGNKEKRFLVVNFFDSSKKIKETISMR